MFRLINAFIILMISVAQQVKAFTADELPLEFDARFLTNDEKRFLQAGLAFQNVYNGMIDGAWGPASQQALERYELKNNRDAFVTNGEVVWFAVEAFDMFEKQGWVEQYSSGLDMSFLVPAKAIRDGSPSEHFVNFELAGTTFGYSLTVSNAETGTRLHSYTISEAATAPYTVRKPDLWISSGRTNSGVTLYTRSDFRRGAWSTIMLSAKEADAGVLAAVSGSIKTGYAPAIGISEGRLVEGVRTVSGLIADPEVGETSNGVVANSAPKYPTVEPTVAPPADNNTPRSSGTAFLVSRDGHYLTNNHVVEGCVHVSVDGNPATILAQDPSFDLALVQTVPPSESQPATFAAKPARLNSDVTVIGYPLPGLLGGLNVTRGAVTSLKGIGGDGVRMQISAPVQSGNSGGPVINASGLVVGVVVSKLDAGLVEEALGDMPQNVNFAIRAEIAKLFLYQNGVEPVQADDEVAVSPEILAELAQGFTRQIICD